jgi:alpha-tubulin suppressor-like RCC1 family protein
MNATVIFRQGIDRICAGLILSTFVLVTACTQAGTPSISNVSNNAPPAVNAPPGTAPVAIALNVGSTNTLAAEVPSGITSIQVQVTATDLSTPVTACAVVSGSSLPTISLAVPAGTGRNFTASAFQGNTDCTGTIRYQGTALNVTLTAGVPATVSITLQFFQAGSPNVVSTFPANSATGTAVNSAITATFDRDMNLSTLTTGTFTVVKTVGAVAVSGTVFYNAFTKTVMFTPSANLDLTTGYTATLTTGVKDLAGNALAAAVSWNFTTANSAPFASFPPVVTATAPTNGATSVALTATVSATFNTTMNASTITASNFTLLSPAGAVTGTVAYNSTSKTATFTPSASLTAGQSYTANLSAGITDSTGVALTPTAWSFTTIPPATVSAVTAIAGGGVHALALRADGLVWAWGDNGAGQLGNGTVVDSSTPKLVSVSSGTGFLSNIIAVVGGRPHSLAIKSDRTVVGWGENNNGELGNGSTSNATVPTPVSGLTDVTDVAGGSDHSLAVKTDGTVRAWGYNGSSQLGDGTTTQRTTPVQVKTGILPDVFLTGVATVAAGRTHSLALKSDGTVWAWGENDNGELGDGTTTNRSLAVQVSGLDGVIAIAAGDDFSLALRNTGEVWAWGYNGDGRLGDGSSTSRSTPVKTSSLTGITAISSGAASGYALKSDGTVWAWGYNGQGQLGDGTTSNRFTPVQVRGFDGLGFLSSVTKISASEGGSCCSYGLSAYALKSDGTVWAWGYNGIGQLGDGTTTNRSTPVQVTGLN